jgi:hypothetical protein
LFVPIYAPAYFSYDQEGGKTDSRQSCALI